MVTLVEARMSWATRFAIPLLSMVLMQLLAVPGCGGSGAGAASPRAGASALATAVPATLVVDSGLHVNVKRLRELAAFRAVLEAVTKDPRANALEALRVACPGDITKMFDELTVVTGEDVLLVATLGVSEGEMKKCVENGAAGANADIRDGILRAGKQRSVAASIAGGAPHAIVESLRLDGDKVAVVKGRAGPVVAATGSLSASPTELAMQGKFELANEAEAQKIEILGVLLKSSLPADGSATLEVKRSGAVVEGIVGIRGNDAQQGAIVAELIEKARKDTAIGNAQALSTAPGLPLHSPSSHPPSAVPTAPSEAAPTSKIDQLGTFKIGASPRSMKGLKKPRVMDDLIVYPVSPSPISGIPMKEIWAKFHKGKLVAVVFTTVRASDCEPLQKELAKELGPPTSSSDAGGPLLFSRWRGTRGAAEVSMHGSCSGSLVAR